MFRVSCVVGVCGHVAPVLRVGRVRRVGRGDLSNWQLGPPSECGVEALKQEFRSLRVTRCSYGCGYNLCGCNLRLSEVQSGSFGVDLGPVGGPFV